jgi:hypothetical protein
MRRFFFIILNTYSRSSVKLCSSASKRNNKFGLTEMPPMLSCAVVRAFLRSLRLANDELGTERLSQSAQRTQR